jgi:hypothetical protein
MAIANLSNASKKRAIIGDQLPALEHERVVDMLSCE